MRAEMLATATSSAIRIVSHSLAVVFGFPRRASAWPRAHFAESPRYSRARGALILKWIEVAPKQFCRGRAYAKNTLKKDYHHQFIGCWDCPDKSSSQLDDRRSTKALAAPPLIGRHSKLCSPLNRWSGGSDPRVRWDLSSSVPLPHTRLASSK